MFITQMFALDRRYQLNFKYIFKKTTSHTTTPHLTHNTRGISVKMKEINSSLPIEIEPLKVCCSCMQFNCAYLKRDSQVLFFGSSLSGSRGRGLGVEAKL